MSAAGQDGLTPERDVAPVLEVVGQPGHRDVVADVALFLGELVGHDREPLDRLRVEPPDDQRGDEPHGDRQPERPEHARERAADEERRGDPRDGGQHVEAKNWAFWSVKLTPVAIPRLL